MSEALQSYNDFMEEGALRSFPVHGDSMAPTLDRGDVAIVRPVTAFVGDGIYSVGLEFPSLYRVAAVISKRALRLSGDNPSYPDQIVSAEWFRENVIGKAVFKVNVIDRALLPDELRF
jgi:phage repressor protein C with HTH and peptisase S24 domain